MVKVSVIIPTFNRKDLVIEAITSVLQQEPKNFEVIVIDDGSTDGTVDYLESLHLPIRIITKPNEGIAYARNEGIRYAQGKYIAFLDSDDLWLPGILQAQAEYLDTYPNVGLVYTDQYLEEYGKRKPDTRFVAMPASEEQKIKFDRPNLIVPQAPIHTSAVMVRKSVLDTVGVFNQTLVLHEDTDMWNRISEKFLLGYIDQPLSVMRWEVDPDHLMKPESRDLFLRELKKYMHVYEDRHKVNGMTVQNKEDIEKSYQRIEQIEHLWLLRKKDMITEEEYKERRRKIFR